MTPRRWRDQSWRCRSPRRPRSAPARRPVVPEDGRNLNRAFPGRADGSFTDALAEHIFDAFIAGSDLLIDLHGGDLFEALEPFTITRTPPSARWPAEDFRWLRCANAGWWHSEVEVGTMVAHGQRLGAILDPFGDELEAVLAPLAGAVAFLTSSPAVDRDGLLLAIAGALTPVGPS